MWQAARQDGLTCGLEDVSVTCSATHPYAVTFATADWLHLCGFADHEVCGKTLAIIQGPASDQGLLRTMMASIRAGEVPLVTENLINYDKQRQPFVHTVTIATVADESGTTTHFHAKSSAIKLFNRGAHCASVDVTTASVSIAGDGASSRCERLVQSVPSYSLPMSRHTAAAAVPRALRCARPLPRTGTWDQTSKPRPPPHPSPSPVPSPSPCRCPPGWGVHEVVTQATAPFAVVHASPGWLSTCGYRLDEITGKDLSCIRAPHAPPTHHPRTTHAPPTRHARATHAPRTRHARSNAQACTALQPPLDQPAPCAPVLSATLPSLRPHPLSPDVPCGGRGRGDGRRGGRRAHACVPGRRRRAGAAARQL